MLLLGAMLRQVELSFIEDVGSMEIFPVLLRELRKALAATTPASSSAMFWQTASIVTQLVVQSWTPEKEKLLI